MSKRDNLLLILDMLDAAQRIQTYTEGLDFDRFIDDQKTLDAVVRSTWTCITSVQIVVKSVQ